jgi:hypothetical protein
MAGILGDGNALFAGRLLMRSRRSIGCPKKTGTRGRSGRVEKNGDESNWEWRASRDDPKESKFFLIEIAILKTAGGNQYLDWS